ncbi:MAG: hypothetical protein IT337_18075 [Thermomicrobiales bacterium]|nr:hypothetical protein [Thermomicrobiales bacterium]
MDESDSDLRQAITGTLWEHFAGGTSITPLTTEDFDYLANRRELTGDVNAVLRSLAESGVIRVTDVGAGHGQLTVTAVLDPPALAREAGETIVKPDGARDDIA